MQIIKNKYSCQKSKAKHRGIDFLLTFDQWWSIWEQSGKWDFRGARKGQYVMSRKNDTGAYEVGNVFIQLCEDNHKQVMLTDEARLVMKHKRLGKTQSLETRQRRSIAMIGKNLGKKYHKKVYI